MPTGGKLAAFNFDGIDYTTAHCLQSWDLANAINNIVYQCNGFDQNAAGTQATVFRVSLALSADDTTRVSAFTPGEQTTQFEAYPAGQTAGNVEVLSTSAQVNTANVSAPINGIIALDVEIALNNVSMASSGV